MTTNKIQQTIETLKQSPSWPGIEAALVNAPRSGCVGAPLAGLRATEAGFLRLVGVLGANGGLTLHGANVRARVARDHLDRLMPL